MIRVENVTKSYPVRGGERIVLDDLSFTIERGRSVGICGKNGAGKSTLLRLLGGTEYPTSGRIHREMTVSWPLGYSMVYQSSLTGADNARFLARIYEKPIDEVLDFVSEFAELGIYFREPVKTYSAGMRARLAFATSLAVDFECILIDEVIAAGDARFHERCRRAITERRSTGSLIMVSHQPNSLRAFCTSGALLHQGGLTFFDSIEEAIKAYEAT
jgi:capsular polysaccharide transport system ATP-binding protein